MKKKKTPTREERHIIKKNTATTNKPQWQSYTLKSKALKWHTNGNVSFFTDQQIQQYTHFRT